jgi:hypothetical protein
VSQRFGLELTHSLIVRRQSFWDTERLKIRESLARQFPLLSPNPFRTYGLNAAEPHIRLRLIVAGAKSHHLEVIGLGGGTNLYHGILQQNVC